MSTSIGRPEVPSPLGEGGPAAAEALDVPLRGERDMLRRGPRGAPDGGLLGKEGHVAAASPQRAPQCGASAGHSIIAQAAEAPWHSGPRTWHPEAKSAPAAQTLALAPWPVTSACAHSSGIGLQANGSSPPWAAVLEMTAHTSPHMVGWCILLGVGAPSQAPVPRHLQGHHLRTLMRVKSSESPPAIEPPLRSVESWWSLTCVQYLGVGPSLVSGTAP